MLECRFVLVLLFPHRHLYLGLTFFFFASFRGPGSIAIWTGPSHKYGKCNRLALSDAIRWGPLGRRFRTVERYKSTDNSTLYCNERDIGFSTFST